MHNFDCLKYCTQQVRYTVHFIKNIRDNIIKLYKSLKNRN